ncbi:MAG TPA: hypothetical protein VJL61_10605 [Rhodanobacteraceae bacterium]|nr:hypothetical protein [Rhodanobacteraceae bacterium]
MTLTVNAGRWPTSMSRFRAQALARGLPSQNRALWRVEAVCAKREARQSVPSPWKSGAARGPDPIERQRAMIAALRATRPGWRGPDRRIAAHASHCGKFTVFLHDSGSR